MSRRLSRLGELSERHRKQLIPTRQTSVVSIAVVAGYTLLELNMGEVSDQLRENGSANIHPSLFRRCGAEAIPALSGRLQFKSFLSRMPTMLWKAMDLLVFAKSFTGH